MIATESGKEIIQNNQQQLNLINSLINLVPSVDPYTLFLILIINTSLLIGDLRLQNWTILSVRHLSEMRQCVSRHVSHKFSGSSKFEILYTFMIFMKYYIYLLTYKSEQIIIPLIINNLTRQLNIPCRCSPYSHIPINPRNLFNVSQNWSYSFYNLTKLYS